MKRIDLPQALLCIAALGAALFLFKYGPPEHKEMIGLAASGFIMTIIASLRGRMVKRAPEKAAKQEKAKEEKRRASEPPPAPPPSSEDTEEEPESRPETD